MTAATEPARVSFSYSSEEWLLVEDLQKNQSIKNKNISFFFPIIGRNYFNNKVRLMVVGRATNGWEFNHLSDIHSPGEIHHPSFADWKTKRNYHDLEKDLMNRSSFWRSTRSVLTGLYNLPDDSPWYENIVWANLCFAAPSSSGNPGKKLREAQRKRCGNLLQDYISRLNPTHILFVTGDKGWFECFNQARSGNILSFEALANTDIDSRYICLTGRIGGAKAVIASRPDSRKRDRRECDYAKAVLQAFAQI